MGEPTFNIENGVLTGGFFWGCSHVEIPAGVTAIRSLVNRRGGGVFEGRKELESVTIPEGVEEIDLRAFLGCSGLQEVRLPSTLKRIGESAFEGCSGLTELLIPEGVTEIAKRAFSGCVKLEKVTFPETLVSIGEDAFGNCEKLEAVAFPASLAYIGKMAFWYCKELKALSGLREAVTLGGSAFTGCSGLADAEGMVCFNGVFFDYCGTAAEVAVPEGVTLISTGAFREKETVTKVTLPEGVKTIAWNAFGGSAGLEQVNFPAGLETIESSAFERCKKLRSVILPDSVTQLGSSAFEACEALTELRLSAGLQKLPWSVFKGCTELKCVEIPASVQEIENNAFYHCVSLEEVKLPQKLQRIGSNAFCNCLALEEIQIPDSVQALSGFSGCSNLCRVNLPAALKSADGTAFEGCKKILTLTIPAGVTSAWGAYPKDILMVVEKVFASGAEFVKSQLNQGSSLLVTFGDPAADGFKLLLNEKCEKLKVFDKKGNLNRKVYDKLLRENECKFPAGLAAFAMLCRLRWPIELEASTKELFQEAVIKNIKKAAPYVNLLPEDGLLALAEEIGAVTEKNKKTVLPLMGIGEAPTPKKKEEAPAADGVKTPAQIKLEWNSKKLPDGTLRLTSYKGSDTEVLVPAFIGKNAVTQIGEGCLSCSPWSRANAQQLALRKKITSVTVPEGITLIDKEAFFMCEAMEKVSLPVSLREIGANAFARCGNLKDLTMPEGVKVESGAFYACRKLADEQGFVILGSVLYNYYGGGDVAIPPHVTRVEAYAFKRLEDLKSVVFPEGLKTIENNTIAECEQLRSVTVPAGVKTIGYSAFGHSRVLVRGFAGSAAEEICKGTYGRLTFEAIGTAEKKVFEIEDGVLTHYRGKEKRVVIPEGVKGIACHVESSWRRVGAFAGNENIEEVIIPEGVTGIVANAFAGCKNLRNIQFPASLNESELGAFEGTAWLAAQEGPAIYAGNVLLRVKGENIEEFTVREGTRGIGHNAFEHLTGLRKVILPQGVEIIGNQAFWCCRDLQELCVPASITELGEDFFYGVEGLKRCYGGVLRKTEPLPAKYKVFYTGEPEDTAWLVLYQPEQSWRKAIREWMNDKPELITPAVTKIAELICDLQTLEVGAGNRAGAFAMDFCKIAEPEALSAVYEALKKKTHPVVKKLDKDAEFKRCMEGGNKEDLTTLHPVEAMVVQKLMHTPAFDKVLDRIVEGVPYTDTQELCAPRVLAFIAYEYIRQYDPEDARYVSMYDTACKAYRFSPVADEAAAALDPQKLQEALLQLAEQYDGEYWLPFARYADDRNTVSLLSRMRDWDDWYKYAATGRKNIIIARSGLLLNHTKAAMIHIDKVGQLGTYAKMRGTDADTLRDTVLADFGFDENREIRYDLGGNVAVVAIDDELRLTIFDQNAGKTVKSIPKKGADAERYEQAKVAFSDLKKNIKKVITNRKYILFEEFLSGREKAADSWKQSYINNPVLNSVARLVVWLQAGQTFILTKEGAVDCFDAPYTITDAPIGVAHPIIMGQQLQIWQSYFTDRGLKQPFEQVWEPAYDPTQIREDRYAGCEIPVYRLNNKEQHGIALWGLTDYSEDYGFTLTDCEMKYSASEWRFVRGVTDDATFKLENFTFEKYTRYVNHIIYLFDKWTVMDRLLQDDVKVEAMLDAFTPAQIREFVHLTTEKGCVNCSAMLLNYQSKRFGQLDPLAEFTLDI